MQLLLRSFQLGLSFFVVGLQQEHLLVILNSFRKSEHGCPVAAGPLLNRHAYTIKRACKAPQPLLQKHESVFSPTLQFDAMPVMWATNHTIGEAAEGTVSRQDAELSKQYNKQREILHANSMQADPKAEGGSSS